MALDGEEYSVRTQPQKMRLIPFLASFVGVGLLFAVQQWLASRIWYPKAGLKLPQVIAAWELQYLLWGVICWALWRWRGEKLQQVGWFYLVTRIVPLSIVLGVAVEMTEVACFPQFPVSREHMTYWQRLDFSLAEEFLENTAVFWAAFAILRGTGHFRTLRQRERAMSELAVELAEARMLALRMQINPHFLFNTMNSISSLMYSDVHAADKMMEQLSNMLRVSLARGSKQMITLREEMEFIEMYLTLQDIRSSGQLRQEIEIDPRLHDALVPAMLLQPIVENAYVHGLSKIDSGGLIEITAKADANEIRICVRNSGIGLDAAQREEKLGAGIGLSNVRSRLRLHFGDQGRLKIRETSKDMVEVSMTFPLAFAAPNDLADVPEGDCKVLYEPEAEAEPVRGAEAS
jgi:two-component system, LytTR family, sensor kinase